MIGGVLGQGATVAISINAIDKFSTTFKAASLGIGAVGAAMKITAVAIVATGAALAGIGLASLKTAAEFETAFTGVRKTVELSEKQFEDLENKFKDLSKTTPITFVELSRIGEIAGQLGVKGVDNISKFTNTIAAISVTTNLTAEEAATSFARIANVMGEPIDNVDKMGSAIVDLGNNFATSEQEIVNMTMRIMGAGKTVGLTTQEVFGMSASLSALGIRSEMGGSAISRAMITMAKSVAEGGDKLESYAQVSGMTVDEFSESWKTKPVEAMSKVIMGLKGITDSGGNTFGVLEDLDLKSIRITDTMLRLTGSQNGVTDAVNMSKTAWEENNALTEEAEKRYDTYDSKVQMLKNTFATFKADVGDTFMPIMKNLVILFTDKVLPALEPLIPLLGDFFSRSLEALLPHIEDISNSFVNFVSILLNDVIPVVLPLITLVGKFLRNAFVEIFKVLKPLLPEFLKFAKLIFDGAMEVVKNLLPALKELIPVFINFWNSLQPLIPKIFELIEKLALAAITIFKEVIPAMSDLIPIIMDIIDVAIALIPPIVDIVTTLIKLISKILKGAAPAITVLKDVILAIIEPIKTVIGWISDLLGIIGDFLGKSSELNKSANNSVKTVSKSYKSKNDNTPIYIGQKSNDIIKLNDFIISNGKIIKPNSQDTIIGTKNPNSLGGGVTIIIEGDINGTDPEQMAEAFARQLKQAIRI